MPLVHAVVVLSKALEPSVGSVTNAALLDQAAKQLSRTMDKDLVRSAMIVCQEIELGCLKIL